MTTNVIRLPIDIDGNDKDDLDLADEGEEKRNDDDGDEDDEDEDDDDVRMLSGVPCGLPRDTEGPSDPDHWLLLTHNGLDNDTDIDEDG